MRINWWVILILGIWFSAAIGNFSPNAADSAPFLAAFFATVLIGIGYLLLKYL